MKRKTYTLLWDDVALKELKRELQYLQKRSADAPRIIANRIPSFGEGYTFDKISRRLRLHG